MYRSIRYFTIMVLMGILPGCSWLPAMPWSSADDAAAGAPDSAGSFEIVSAGLLTDRTGRPELGLEIRNVSGQLFWGQVAFFTRDANGDCVLIKEIAAGEDAFYRCPQSVIYPGDYRIQVEIFADQDQTIPIDRFATSIPVTPADIDVFRNIPKR